MEKGVIGASIDSLGIERNQPQHETHRTLLGNKIMILEGLRLKHVEEGSLHINCSAFEYSRSRGFSSESIFDGEGLCKNMRVLLTTLNSKFIHSNLALRYLKVSCKKLTSDYCYR